MVHSTCQCVDGGFYAIMYWTSFLDNLATFLHTNSSLTSSAAGVDLDFVLNGNTGVAGGYAKPWVITKHHMLVLCPQ